MELRNFRAGVFRKQSGYKSFSPALVNHDWQIGDSKINHLLSEANHKLGELNAFSVLVPDVDFFLRMHIGKEATQSSRIEGTLTSMEDVFQKAENISPEKMDDWREVQNYIRALNFSVGQLKKLPLSSRLLRLTHEQLMRGVRGKQKAPGEFRRSQNWIGGSSLREAVYVPPVHTEIPELMSDLEKFLNNDVLHVPQLIRIGIAHYQFESIHPFLDGNGRLGRLMIILHLLGNGILSKPALYLSDYFERNRRQYYDALTAVREKNDMSAWLKFFLKGVNDTAVISTNTLHSIIELRKNVEEKRIIRLGKRAPLAQELIHFLYGKPVVDAAEITRVLKVNASTTHRLIQDFERIKILKEKTGFRRNRVFVFEEYLKLFSK